MRRFLTGRGCSITLDYTFEDGKFYDLIAGEAPSSERAAADYTDWELRFGRDNLRSPSPAFLKWIRGEREKLRGRLLSPAMSHESREELRKRQYELEVILDAIEGDV